MRRKILKALTLRASSIGDCLMGKYFLENVHAAYPDVRCAVLVGSRGMMIRDLFAAYPWIEVIEANRRSPRALIELWQKFSGSDLTLTQYAGKNWGSFGLASKIAARLLTRRGGLYGFEDSFRFNDRVYDRILPLRFESAPAELERAALGAAEILVGIPALSFSYVPQLQLLGRLELQPAKYVVLHLFSGGRARGVSPEYRQKLISRLAAILPKDFRLVLTGSRTERESLGDALPENVRTAATSLQELAALIDASAGMVSIDTGAAHLAAHMRKPLVVLASCVGEQWWSREMYREGVPAAVFTRTDVCTAGHDYSGYANCLEAISVDEVVGKAGEIFI